MSRLRGLQWIAGAAQPGRGAGFQACDAKTGAGVGPLYAEAAAEQVDAAAMAAAAASLPFADAPRPQRAALLRAIADGLLALGDELVDCVSAETALPAGRVQNERARTVLQLQQFAALVEEGSYVDARIDHGDPARPGNPKPDLRRMLVALGPVAVFGASNFPLAYSVAGGDTASALAAGCPVVVKAHPAHPGTSELVAGVIAAAVARLGLPSGVFSLLQGREHATGARLVQHPAIAAVGFTGSHRGGRALMDLAAARPRPIPVFAEMGSMNPVVVLPRAMAARGAAIADQLASSALLAMGQFCTSPGMLLWLPGPGVEAFQARLAERLAAAAAGPVVHPTIRQGFEAALAELGSLPVQVAARGAAAADWATAVCPTLLQAEARHVVAQERLRSEIYGPAVLGVACASAAELQAVLASLDGHLTGTVHGDGEDFAEFAAAIALLRSKVGRLLANGVPTGVEVCPSMVHGGPYPAASDARYSAVGSSAIQRWLRPACWQDWPAAALPAELQDGNPCGIRRLVDGVWG
jgi:NADP-dependent aldehyde dehydrogenase